MVSITPIGLMLDPLVAAILLTPLSLALAWMVWNR